MILLTDEQSHLTVVSIHKKRNQGNTSCSKDWIEVIDSERDCYSIRQWRKWDTRRIAIVCWSERNWLIGVEEGSLPCSISLYCWRRRGWISEYEIVDLDYIRRREGKEIHPEMKIYGMKYYEVTHMDIDNVMESKEL